MTWLFAGALTAALAVSLRGRVSAYRATGRWSADGDYRPRTATEARSRRTALVLFAIALPALFLAVGVELFGTPLGLVDPAEGCPRGWASPRAIAPV